MFNSSNSSGGNLSVQASPLFAALLTIDHIFRYYGVLISLIFILVFIFSPSMQTRHFLYVNHATIVSIMYPIIMFVFIFGNTPNTSDPNLNQILCTLSAYLREFANYIRPYSILLIAMYRYIAVFHLTFYQRINRSRLLLCIPILFVWVISLLFPICINRLLNTTSTSMLCINGNSESTLISILFFVVSFTIMMILPSIVTIFIYVQIMRELKMVRFRFRQVRTGKVTPIVMNAATTSTHKKSNITNSNSSIRSSSVASIALVDRKKERQFAVHFILMCASVVLTNVVFSVFYQTNIMPNYFLVLYYYLPVLRILVAIGVSLLPISSLYFHPVRARFTDSLKQKFKIICRRS